MSLLLIVFIYPLVKIGKSVFSDVPSSVLDLGKEQPGIYLVKAIDNKGHVLKKFKVYLE